MKYLIAILVVFCTVHAFAKKVNESVLVAAVNNLNIALVKKDSNALKGLVADKLSYGHSNGWVQTKGELINDLFNGKITYNKINNTAQTVAVHKKTAWVRAATEIDAVLDKKQMAFKLNALQVWVWEKQHWILFARQSVKA